MSVTVTGIEVERPGCSVICQYAEEEEEEEESSLESSESSSIGKNSDKDEEGGARCSASEEEGENEAQSCYKGGLDMMEELDQVLPMRRGISKFYNGKSKSFTSLADASASSSVQEIIKPENAYSRRCRNLLAFNHVWDKNRGSPLRGNAAGGISKRPLSSSKSTLALAVALTHSESYSSASEDSCSSNVSRSPLLSTSLPFTHEAEDQTTSSFIKKKKKKNHQLGSFCRNFSTWKSYFVADLHRHATPANMVPYESITEKFGRLEEPS